MPMQLVKRKENRMRHDATVVLEINCGERSRDWESWLDPSRSGEVFLCRTGSSARGLAELHETVLAQLRDVIASAKEPCGRLGVVVVLPEGEKDVHSAVLKVLQDALIRLLRERELKIDLVLPDWAAAANGDRLRLCQEYLARHYAGSGKSDDLVNQVLAGILAKLAGNMPLPGASLAAGDGPIEKLSQKIPAGASKELRQFIEEEQEESFYNLLKKEIEKRGMTEVECYKKANISRKLYSKIKNQPFYKPSKQTAAAFAIALEMDLEDADGLLGCAGYTLSGSSLFDMIIKFHIKEAIYDIYEINNVLYDFDQCLLGG